MKINLISDTVTKPSQEMLDFMFKAEVGDDVFREDPMVNELEAYASDLFGKEASLYCPSGTMTNQIAIKTHTQPLDEMICEVDSHVYQYENGGYAFNSGIAVNTIQGQYGKLKAEQVQSAIKPDYDWLPNSKIVVVENTCNKGGGSIYKLEELNSIGKVCNDHNLRYHLDGARLFNALVETGDSTSSIGSAFDSISICLSKGLGAPVGSLLIGDKGFIKRARKFRKVMGGGMRQAGYIAAAGLFALKNNVNRLKVDNDRAKAIGSVLEEANFVSGVKPVQSNIVIFDLIEGITPAMFLEKLSAFEIHASAFGPRSVRFVTHLDVSAKMIEKILEVLSTGISSDSFHL